MSLPGCKAASPAAPGHSDGVLTRGSYCVQRCELPRGSPPLVGKISNELVNFEESVPIFHTSKDVGPIFHEFQATSVDDYVVFQRILGLIIFQFMFPKSLEFITTSFIYNTYRSVIRIIERGT